MTNERMTWEEIIKHEPLLERMYQQAVKHGERGVQSEEDCPNAVWYGQHGMKAMLCRLVGYGAANPAVSSHDAYDVAYDKIYWALADCSENCCLQDRAED